MAHIDTVISMVLKIQLTPIKETKHDFRRTLEVWFDDNDSFTLHLHSSSREGLEVVGDSAAPKVWLKSEDVEPVPEDL
jgi:hypothetical protein